MLSKFWERHATGIIYFISFLLIFPIALGSRFVFTKLEAQSTASYGTTVTSLSTASTGAVTGTVFGVPQSYASVITWQVVADGSALSVNLEASNDGTTFGVIDSQTTAAGGIRTTPFMTAKYVRISQSSRTGGTSTTATLVTNRGFITTSSPGNLSGLQLNGNLLFAPDGTYNIGAASTNRPIQIFSSGTITSGAGFASNNPTAGGYNFLNHGSLRSVSDGIFRLNDNAATGATFLALGPNTASFAAIQSLGNTLRVRLGDNTANASLASLNLQLSSTAFASLPADGNGTVRYCSDCNLANPCTSGGTGALAVRLNGAWVCSF